jgi:hypothetical protein
MTADSFPDSTEDLLNDLDPLSRALLDLSMQRGMNDVQIAEVLGTDRDSVFEVRVGLLRNLAERVAPEQAEAELPELEAAVATQLYPPHNGEPCEPIEVDADDRGDDIDDAGTPDPGTVDPGTVDPGAARERRSTLVVVVPILLLAAITALVVVLAGGTGDDTDSNATRPAVHKPTPTHAAPQRSHPVRLEALASGSATGKATVTGDRVKLTLRSLPSAHGGTYGVWLYNSIIDAKRVGTVHHGKANVTLPKDARKYRYVDLSIEPRDGNPNHSGQSILRLPVGKLQN